MGTHQPSTTSGTPLDEYRLDVLLNQHTVVLVFSWNADIACYAEAHDNTSGDDFSEADTLCSCQAAASCRNATLCRSRSHLAVERRRPVDPLDLICPF